MVGDVKLEDICTDYTMSEHLVNCVNNNHCGIVTVKIQEPYAPSWSIRLNWRYTCSLSSDGFVYIKNRDSGTELKVHDSCIHEVMVDVKF